MKSVWWDEKGGSHSAGCEILPIEMFGCGDGGGIEGMG